MPQPDRVFIGHMLAAAARITELTSKIDRETFDADWVIQDAVIRELEVFGEAAGRVSKTVADNYPEIPWREITGMRHKLIHDYFVVDLGIVWTTATTNVPAVVPLLHTLAADHGIDLPGTAR
jgi:uncharacterized protein with HEPN domain